MNSKTMNSTKKLACGLGIHQEEQLSILDQMKNSISTMRVIGKKSLLPFQKGILISIASTKGLFKEVSDQGLQFLLTAHCNSDPTENAFSCLRTMGVSNDHPGPVDCMNRIRLLIMSRDAEVVVNSSAVEIETSFKNDSLETDICSAVLNQSFPGCSSES